MLDSGTNDDDDDDDDEYYFKSKNIYNFFILRKNVIDKKHSNTHPQLELQVKNK